jgi:uncharacterized protein involved in outer membrane biogenesis
MAAVTPAPRPRRRLLRWLLIVPSVLLLLAAGAVAAAVLLIDPNAQKPRIAGMVKASTGRDLTLAGPIGFKASLVPTVTLDDVSLANMPGGTRPEMAKVGRVEAQFALLPLLSRRLELRRVVLRAPDILLETDAEGRPNWAFTPAGASPAEAAPPVPASTPAPPPPAAAPGEVAASTPRPAPISLARIAVSDGHLIYRDGVSGRSRSLAVERFRTEPVAGGDGLLRFDAAATLDGLPITAEGQAGGPERLLGASAASPWPVRLAVAAAGADARVEGAVEQPLRGRGWRLAVAAKVPDVARFAAVLPNVPMPPLRDLDLAATVSDAGTDAAPDTAQALPHVADLRFAIGANDLSWLWPGLRLARFSANAPGEDGPVALDGAASGPGDVPLRISGSVGAPRRFLAGTAGPEPWPIDLAFGAGAGTAALKGRIQDVSKGAVGIDLDLAARVPELAALSPLAGRPLPPVRDIALDTHVAERGRGFSGGAILRGLRIASSAGDAAGDLTYAIGQRQGVFGELASKRLDVDAWLPPAAPPAPGAAAPAPAGRGDGRIIPDRPLPLDLLRVTQDNLRWTVDELVAGGVALRQVLLAVAIEDGRARLDPFVATLPGGQVMVRGGADSTADPPTVQMSAQAAGLDLAPLLAALRTPPRLAGKLDLDLDLHGAGRDLRAVAAGLSGHLGLALLDGTIDAALLQGLPAELRGAVLSQAGATGNRVPLRCGALRVEAESGAAKLRALLLETALGRVGGEGGVNLRDESVAVRLHPDLRLGPIAFRAPVNVAGTLAAPRVGVSPEAAAAAGLGALLSTQRTPDRDLQALAGALGGGGAGAGPAAPDCASQLALARGGRAGAMPSSPAPAAPAAAPAAAAPAGVPREMPKQAEDMLRGLFGRGRQGP